MTQDQQKFTERELFLTAASLHDREERNNFLVESCRGQPDLQERIERLLAAREGNHCSPLNHALQTVAEDLEPGGTECDDDDVLNHIDIARQPVLDRYQLIEEIGRGGMGTVYRAYQTKPVRRYVAVKVINPGMNSRKVLARFEAERQTLAMMEHPNIARVFDGGQTEFGLPYFVMELVSGSSILKYCRHNSLSLRARLELFIEVCNAIQHAHQKGVIHRDLKPSNILVETRDGVAIPRIIDFGIAKAVNSDAEFPNVTGFREVLGTPMYMSPEQAEFNAIDVDTRSDVYSMGVLLYELVTDHPPFDRERIQQAGFSELFHIIREEIPPRPSGSTTNRNLTDEPALGNNSIPTDALARRIRGELDWIVMKALEKNRQQRYQSARDLADDVQRFLNHEPIAARPPSTMYRIQKTVRRHRTLITGAIIACLALLLGTSLAVWQAHKAGQSLQLAEHRAELVVDANRRLEDQVRIAQSARSQAEELLYVNEVHLAGTAFWEGDFIRAQNLLTKQTQADRNGLTGSFEWQYLNQSVKRKPDWTESFLGQIRCVRLSPDGRHAAVAARDSLLRILDIRTGRSVCQCLAWTMLNSAAWSPDGRQLACACADGTVRLYSFRATDQDREANETPRYNLRLVQTLEAQTSPTEANYIDDAGEANDALFTPDGRWLVTAGDDSLIRIWDRQQESLVATLNGHKRAVERLALSSTGSFLVSASSDDTFRLWDMKTQVPRGDAIKLSGRVVSLAVSRDGRFVAAGDINGELVLLESMTGDLIRRKNLDGIESLAFAAFPDRLVTGDRAGIIRSWGLTALTGDRLLDQQDECWLAHKSRIQALASHPQTGRIISGSRDGVVSTWPGNRSNKPVRIDAVTAFGFDHNGDLLLGNHQLLRLSSDSFEISSHEPLSTAGWELMDISPNSARAILASDEEIVVQDLQTNSRITQWPSTRHTFRVAISPDGRLAATVDYSGSSISLRNANDGGLVREFPIESCRCLAFSPDGRMLAAGCLDDLLLFSLDLNDAPIVLSGHSSTLRCVSFSPDGKTIATGSNDRQIRIWDAASGQTLLDVAGHSDNVASISYSQDGARIVSSGESGNIRIWHASSMQPLLDIEIGGDVPTEYAELSPDNRRLAVIDRIGTVTVFDSAVTEQQVPGAIETASDETIELEAVGDLTGGIHRSLPAGISADGTLVVGRSFHSAGVSPFVWSKTDGIRPLGPQYPDGLNGDCKCVSVDQSVFGGAGEIEEEPGSSARLWFSDGSTRRIAEGPGMVVAISSDNQTVAGHAGPQEKPKPFLERDQALLWLPLPSTDHFGVAAAMTPDGETVLGTVFRVSEDGEGDGFSDWRESIPALWKNGEFQEISSFDPLWNWKAVDISDDGNVIVGSCWAPGDRIHHPGARAFLWRDGELKILEPPPGFLEFRPSAISGDGSTIVGRLGQTLRGKESHACLWTSQSGFVDLDVIRTQDPNLMGWTLMVDALDVSSDGQYVAGYGRNSNGDLEAWRLRFGSD